MHYSDAFISVEGEFSDGAMRVVTSQKPLLSVSQVAANGQYNIPRNCSGLMNTTVQLLSQPQNDVARSVMHYIERGRIVIFSQVLAVKTHGSSSGN